MCTMVYMKQLSQWYSVGLMYVRVQSDGDLPTKKRKTIRTGRAVEEQDITKFTEKQNALL